MSQDWSCPRCGLPLREKTLRGWRTFFECGGCWATFEPVIEKRWQPTAPQSAFTKFLRHTITLQPGRSRCRRSK
jgi:rubredoxin